MQNKKDKEKASQIANDILFRIKDMFKKHGQKVQSMNENKNGNGNRTSQVPNSFYNSLNILRDELRAMAKRVKSNQKLRKQRSQMFEAKLLHCAEAIDALIKKRNIKIKLNQYVIGLVEQNQKALEEANRNLKNYQRQTGVFCGKSYDFKPAVERSLTDLAEFSAIWNALPHLDSVANDSVKEIYLPVKYDETIFKDIQNQILKAIPAPVIIQKTIKSIEVKQDSQLQEAHQLLFGFTRSQQVDKAIKIYKNQSEKSNCHPVALNALGCLYEQGKYLNKDLKKAFKYFIKSSKINDPEGLYKVGKYLQKGLITSAEEFQGLYSNRQSEIRGGIQYYQKAAKLGHLDAITDLGYIYEKGIINEEDQTTYYIQPYPEHSIKYYMKAKQSDFPRAYNNLGALYIRCQDISEEVEGSNLQKGIKYLKKAVELKYPKSFINLGKCYEAGVGVVQNLDRARALFLQGSELGDIQCKLEYVKSHMGSSLDDDKTMMKLVEVTRQVLLVDKHNAEALYYMGLFFEKGIGVQPNKQSSFFYIESSARLDYPPALTKLGDFCYSGYHAPKNIDFAKSLYQKAAKKNDSQALINLGLLMEKGLNSQNNPHNINRAHEYYQEAAKMGNTNALLLMGFHQNKQYQSQGFVKKAAQLGNINAIKLLNNTKNTILQKKIKEKTSYDEVLKKMSTFYIKQGSSKDSSFYKS